VNVVGNRPVHEAGAVVIQHEHTPIEIPRRHKGFQTGAETGRVSLPQHLLCITALFQHIAPRKEAVVLDLRRVFGKEGIAPTFLLQAGFDFLCGITRINSGINRRPHIQCSSARNDEIDSVIVSL